MENRLKKIYLIGVSCEVKPLDADMVIVDEMSMVDIFLMNHLVKALYNDTKLILVGDVDQLPSVGPGNVLKDLIASNYISTIHLKKIFRQAQKSKIILNAHRVNEGEYFLNSTDNDLKNDFFFIKEQNQDKMIEELVSICSKRLKEYKQFDFFKDIQVLSPTKKGPLGTKELNKKLQEALNIKNKLKNEKNYGQTVFREGDKVMQIKNNYDMLWEKEKEAGSGIFNGDLGIIKKIDDDASCITVLFDDEKEVRYQYSDLEQLEHSYVTTIHKSQGSEFNVVVLVLPKVAPVLLTRNLLYTAITRAKEMLIIIGAPSTVEFMINNNKIKDRNTGLSSQFE